MASSGTSIARNIKPRVEHAFPVHICVIGEVSVGKTTLLNAFFGDYIAQTGIDRTSGTVIHFVEGTRRVLSANQVYANVSTSNASEFDAEEKHDREVLDKHWVLRRLWSYDLKDFQRFPSHVVPESTLVPKTHKYENFFSVLDFPGFNDKINKERVVNHLSKYSINIDYVFYMFDALKGIIVDSTEQIFRDFLSKNEEALKSKSRHHETRLVIIFNKCDQVDQVIRPTLERQKRIIDRILQEKGIEREEFFEISAIQMLLRALLQDGGKKLVDRLTNGTYKKRSMLLHELHEFAGEYFGKKQLRAMETEPIEKQVAIIADRMAEEEKDATPQDHVSHEFLQFLKNLRHIRAVYKRAKFHVDECNLTLSKYVKPFLTGLQCLKYHENHDEKSIGTYVARRITGAAKRRGKADANVTADILVELQYHLNLFDYTEFSQTHLKAIVRACVKNRTLHRDTLEIVRRRIRMREHRQYWHHICHNFIQVVLAKAKKANESDEDEERAGYGLGRPTFARCLRLKLADLCQIDYLVNIICMVYAKKKVSRTLVEVLKLYPFVKEPRNACRALDLIQSRVSIPQLMQVLDDDYESYEFICSKFVKIPDEGFKALVHAIAKHCVA